jgi:3-keto-5-aminohexanoate cleavage enzyme
MWTRDWIMKTAKRMRELGIKPELEIFNIETLEDVFDIYQPAGILDDPISLSFVMGMNKISQGAISYSEQNLDFMISKLPKDQNVNFSTISIGAKTHLTGVVQTLLKGGNVRVGFEDNVYYNRGELAISNAQMVERVVRIIRELGMEVATPDEARQILKLKKM